MRYYMLSLFCLVTLAGCAATSMSTAYVPQAVAPAVAPVQYVPVRVAPKAAAPCAPAAAAPACVDGSCGVPASGGYMVTNTSYHLAPQAAQAVMIPADLIGCGANFLRCVWQTVVNPVLPPGPSTQTPVNTYGAPGCGR